MSLNIKAQFIKLLFTSLLCISIIFALLSSSAYFYKSVYEKNNAVHFMDSVLEKSAEQNDVFLLSEAMEINWDKVCYVYVRDFDHRSMTVHEFMAAHGLRYGHWTQWLPYFSFHNFMLRDEPNYAHHAYEHEYSEAFLFIKDNIVVQLIKPELAPSAYRFSAIHWPLISCEKDVQIELLSKRGRKQIFHTFYLRHP